MCSSICFSLFQASAGSFRRSSHAEEGQSPVRVTLYMFLDDRGGGGGEHELPDLKGNSNFSVIIFFHITAHILRHPAIYLSHLLYCPTSGSLRLFYYFY